MTKHMMKQLAFQFQSLKQITVFQQIVLILILGTVSSLDNLDNSEDVEHHNIEDISNEVNMSLNHIAPKDKKIL